MREQSLALARGDGGKACALFTPRARRDVEALLRRRSPDFPLDCVFAVQEGAGTLAPEVRAALRAPRIVAVEVHGDRAEATLDPQPALRKLAAGLGRGDSPGGTPLRKLRGRWRVDGLAF